MKIPFAETKQQHFKKYGKHLGVMKSLESYESIHFLNLH